MATANRRSLVMDAPVHPAILPGLVVIVDTVTLSDTIVLTVTFPAKTILGVFVTNHSGNEITAEGIAIADSVTSNVATVTFTCAKSGSTINFSYQIWASMTETIAANTITATTTNVPVS